MRNAKVQGYKALRDIDTTLEPLTVIVGPNGCEFVPQIERIRTRRAPVSLVEAQEVPVGLDREGKDVLATRHYQRNVIGSEIVFDFSHAKGVQAKHASEGTLLLLALLTVVATEDAWQGIEPGTDHTKWSTSIASINLGTSTKSPETMMRRR